jgi:hypothetical protein
VTRATKENNNRSAKSDFVFLENDDGEETAVYHRVYRYDHLFVSELDLADLLYQDRRYRANGRCKQSCIGSRIDGDIDCYGDYRDILARMTEDGGIRYGVIGT